MLILSTLSLNLTPIAKELMTLLATQLAVMLPGIIVRLSKLDAKWEGELWSIKSIIKNAIFTIYIFVVAIVIVYAQIETAVIILNLRPQ